MADSIYAPGIATLVCALVTYAICGIPFGKILGKVIGHVDLQKVGSGNIGTTNALRAAGPKVAALTLLCDVLKGVLCMNVSRAVIAGVCFAGDASALEPGGSYDYLTAIIGIACVVGHMFSPYLHFKGGKSIAVGVGVLFGMYWPMAILHLAIFGMLVALTGYVSVGSIVTAGLVGVTMTIVLPQTTLACRLIMGALGLLIVWAHRGNIKKLRAGTESKLSFTKRVNRMDDAS